MLIAFVDESYELGAGDVYLVSAVVCDGGSLADLETGLDQCVKDASKAFGTPSSAELHGYDLYHGTGEWTAVSGMPRAQISIYAAAFDAINSSGAEVFVSSTRPNKLNMDPHSLTLRYLIEKLDLFAEHQNEYILMICDDLHTRADHRHSLDFYRTYSTGGWQPRQISRVLDTMHFGDSSESRGLQAADLVAFLRRRQVRAGLSDPLETAANDKVWGRLDIGRIHLKSWSPW